MNLQCEPELAAAYKSRSQIARILTEDWCARELYCAACSSNTLRRTKTNAATVDFFCPQCAQPYQLKSRLNAYTSKITDAAYAPMIRAIREDRTPNLLFLQYSSNWAVSNLLLVPRQSLASMTTVVGYNSGRMGRDTRTGGVLEAMVLPALTRGGYTYKTQVNIGKRPGRGNAQNRCRRRKSWPKDPRFPEVAASRRYRRTESSLRGHLSQRRGSVRQFCGGLSRAWWRRMDAARLLCEHRVGQTYCRREPC